MILTRDEILKAQDIDYEVVEVPEWGGEVRVRAMTAAERDAFEASILRQTKSGVQVEMVNLRARLCAMTIVDEDGKRIFSDSDVAELGKKSAAALQRVFDAAMRLSKFGNEDIQNLAENLKNDQPGGLPTD
jgi:hypothetical protein